MTAKVVPFPPRKANPEKPEPTLAELVAKVHELAKAGNNFRWGAHFKERLAGRGVTMRQVLETLKSGDGVSKRRDEYGDWRVKLRRKVASRRVQVVVAIKGNRLSGVTVI